MTMDALRETITAETGIPSALLTGNNAQEILARARMLLELRQSGMMERGTPAERFATWLSDNGFVESETDDLSSLQALEKIENDLHLFPSVQDAGEVTDLPDYRSTAEKFAEWFNDATAFNPRSGNGDSWN